MVRSVEKAFRVLGAFDEAHLTMGLSQLAAAADLDKSAAQRFAHTLRRLGFLSQDEETRRFRLTVRALDFASRYLRANPLVRRATPYLLHLSKETEETVNLTVLDGAEIVFVTRFQSRHVLNTDVSIGTRMPAFCTAPGIAMLAQLPTDEARERLESSDLRAFTPHTTWRLAPLLHKLEMTAKRGYATAFDEFFLGDLSTAAAIVDPQGRPLGAINIAVSRARFTPEQVEERFAPMVVAAARAISGSERPIHRPRAR